MAPTAKSLILDLLSTLRRGAMPVRALVAAGALFGVAENNLRVSLARLLAAGLVERDERGRYRLGQGARAVNREVGSWRRLEERVRTWRGDWAGVVTAGIGRSDRRDRARRERALRFYGFRPLAPGLAVRPDNLAGGIGVLRESLYQLGLDPGASVMRIADLDEDSEARARSLWDVAALREGYRATREQLDESAGRLPGLATEQAMVESFVVGGRALRRIVLDPLLPEPLLPGAERRALIDAMRRYDRLGRSLWAGFLESFGVPHLRAPVDLRMVESTEQLAAAAGGHA